VSSATAGVVDVVEVGFREVEEEDDPGGGGGRRCFRFRRRRRKTARTAAERRKMMGMRIEAARLAFESGESG